MRAAIDGLERYVAGNAQGKRLLFVWADAEICPSNLTNVFAFDDDYSMGVLTSSLHRHWAISRGSTLEDRPRYTPTTVFETFPWPQPSPAQRTHIGQLSAAVIDRRRAICSERRMGLTTLYNQVDDGAWADLAALHESLDNEVAGAYGWQASVARDAVLGNAHLAALNRRIADGEVEYTPFDPSPAA